jgi:hypothetical protein
VVGDEEAARSGRVAHVDAELGVAAAGRRPDEEIGAREQRHAVPAASDQSTPDLVGVGVDARVVPDHQEPAELRAVDGAGGLVVRADRRHVELRAERRAVLRHEAALGEVAGNGQVDGVGGVERDVGQPHRAPVAGSHEAGPLARRLRRGGLGNDELGENDERGAECEPRNYHSLTPAESGRAKPADRPVYRLQE